MKLRTLLEWLSLFGGEKQTHSTDRKGTCTTEKLSNPYLLDHVKHQRVQLTEHRVAGLQLDANVERFDPCQIFKQVEVPLEGSVLRILQTTQLTNEELENHLKGKTNHVCFRYMQVK